MHNLLVQRNSSCPLVRPHPLDQLSFRATIGKLAWVSLSKDLIHTNICAFVKNAPIHCFDRVFPIHTKFLADNAIRKKQGGDLTHV